MADCLKKPALKLRGETVPSSTSSTPHWQHWWFYPNKYQYTSVFFFCVQINVCVLHKQMRLFSICQLTCLLKQSDESIYWCNDTFCICDHIMVKGGIGIICTCSILCAVTYRFIWPGEHHCPWYNSFLWDCLFHGAEGGFHSHGWGFFSPT